MAELKRHIVFCDGTFAIIIGSIKEIEKGSIETRQNEKFYQFHLRPTPITINKNSITEKDKNFVDRGTYAGTYLCEYKKDYCFPLDPNARTWLLTCDWKSKFIDLPNTIIGLWRDKLDNIRKQNKSLRGQVNSLIFELMSASSNPSKWQKKVLKMHKKLVEEGTPTLLGPSYGTENGQGQEQ